ncbi:MAG: ASCH/PUA domain-containing protein [Lachnospiraceae bacterium]
MVLGDNLPRAHRIKIPPEYFTLVKARIKNFELRKNDRGYEVGDTLVLCEWNEKGEYFTGNEVTRKVKCMLEDAPGWGLKEGYCIMGW